MDIAHHERIIVSACLLGVNCRHNGENCCDDRLMKLKREMFVPVCPEKLGGLATPREPCEIKGGSGEDVLLGRAKVIGLETGIDYSGNFIRGAQETLMIIKLFNSNRVIFKSHSPSCGCGEIYLEENLTAGNGVTAALLLKEGIEVEAF